MYEFEEFDKNPTGTRSSIMSEGEGEIVKLVELLLSAK
jgi:hypothetical protein